MLDSTWSRKFPTRSSLMNINLKYVYCLVSIIYQHSFTQHASQSSHSFSNIWYCIFTVKLSTCLASFYDHFNILPFIHSIYSWEMNRFLCRISASESQWKCADNIWERIFSPFWIPADYVMNWPTYFSQTAAIFETCVRRTSNQWILV